MELSTTSNVKRRPCNTTTMIMISNNVKGIYEGGGGRIAAGGWLFAGGLFAAELIAGGLFAGGLNAAPRTLPHVCLLLVYELLGNM